MKYEQFKNAIEAAGFTTDYNRISATNQDGVNIKDVIEAQGFKKSTRIVRGKTWVDYQRPADDFFLTHRDESELGHFSGMSINDKEKLA